MTRSARRQAAACGAGAGGSCGANGGVSGFGGFGIFSLRMKRSSLHDLPDIGAPQLREGSVNRPGHRRISRRRVSDPGLFIA